ncbi:tropomyosin-like [Ruditapes philippinarum]|uniref:tropomyosin-like n=1 Tax=Ruditapes philippinarum TaxID=129788 RepID=UPI00295BD23A|nr:tropomyosin-like [Ruditapes philippinarum]
MEEKDLRESLVNQLSYEGREKDREMLHQLDENKLLMMEYNSLKNMLEAHEDSVDKLRKALEEKDACIVNHEKNIKALEDKVLHYYKTMEDQNDKISELKENLQNVEEQIVFYMEKETVTNEKIENLEEQIKAKEEEIETERKNHTFKVEMLNEDLKSYQENIDELQLEYERSQQQLNVSETNVKNLETKINTLTETLKSKEEATEKLSSKSMELEELTQQLSLLESARQQRTIENIEISNENKELKVKIEEIEKQNNATCTELEFLKTEYQSMKEKTETQTSEISELLRRCSSAELRAANVEADRNQAQSRDSPIDSWRGGDAKLEEIRKENLELKELETRSSFKTAYHESSSNLSYEDEIGLIEADDNECLRLKVRHLEHKLSEGKPPHEALRLQKENIVPHHKDFLSGEYTQRSPQYNTLQNREPKK